ncbi:MAG: hypothetical protein KF723_20920 [Rhizobiaceae bacterium]|nr:hypothetical protein [Rhizobiaceae bacterium]
MLGPLIAAVASGEFFGAIRRARGAVVAYLFAVIFGLTGLGFLIGAAYTLAARRWGSVEASLGFGVGFILLAGLVMAAHAIGRRRRATLAAKQRSVDVATVAGAAAVTLLPVLMRAKGGLGVLLPVIAAAAYAVYRENSRGKPGGDPPV